MAGLKLTQRTVEDAVCPADKKDILLFDQETRGFGLRVTAAGSKVFLAQYQAPGGKRRVSLGAFGVLTVEQARKAAKGVLGAAALGGDPVAERRAKAAADCKAKAVEEFTVRKLIEAWAAAREGDRRASYLATAKAQLIRNLSVLLDRPASEVTVGEAVRLLDHIKETRGIFAANRTLSYARAAFGWAQSRQMLEHNPLRGIERLGREMARERVLTAAEMGAIWRGCDRLNPALAGCVRVLMVTLARRDEVSSMRWAELDSAEAPTTWTLPRDRAKNARQHVVHLSQPARAIIRAMPRIKDNPFVFASLAGKEGPIKAFSYIKREIEAAIAEAGSSVPDWRLHDFRRAGVTALADMGFPPHVCDRLLNHVTGTIRGVAAVYQRAEFLAERKAALDAWAEFVMGAAGGRDRPANVVQLAFGGVRA